MKKKYSLIILPNEELKKLDLKTLGWQYMAHLNMESEEDFQSVVDEIKEYWTES